MARLLTLNNQAHADLKINLDTSHAHHEQIHMVPVVANEFLKLSTNFPILLTKNAETGQFVSVALMGFQEGENLFWKHGKLDSLYTPLNLERSPFYLGFDQNDAMIVCVDMDNPGVGDSSGLDVFDDNGDETSFLENAKGILSTLWSGEQFTQDFIQTLNELDLVQPIKIDIVLHDKSRVTVNGLYSINDEKLDSLEGEILSDLNKKTYLKLIYLMANSLAHIAGLIKRRNDLIDKAIL